LLTILKGGDPNHFWQQPQITSETRSFFEDITNEISIQLQLRPLAEKQTAKTNFTYAPVPADRSVQIVLGYLDYPTRSRIIEIDPDEPDHPHYISLGADRDFRDDYLIWAYDRQCACDPSNVPYYLDCLSAIAQGRESSDLQTKVVMVTSAGEYGLKFIHDSYRFFGLDPSTEEGDDHIIGVYRSRIESAPRQKEEARNSLLAIARARGSEKIKAVAYDRTMTLEEALEFFNAPANIESDSLEAVAVSMVKLPL
jgi:ubiquitin carboxyl-terminal hydrolase 25/28